MRKMAVLLVGITLSGCSGFGEYLSSTFWPEDRFTPAGQSEVMRRVRGKHVRTLPLVAEGGDIWPGQPDPVPTIQDVSNPNSRFSRNFQRGLAKLNTDQASRNQLADAETLAIGEDVNTKTGVKRRSQAAVLPGTLPESVPDNAQQFLEGPNSDSVFIPNGDGTTTVVAPDGSVKVFRGDEASILASQKAAHKAAKGKGSGGQRRISASNARAVNATKPGMVVVPVVPVVSQPPRSSVRRVAAPIRPEAPTAPITRSVIPEEKKDVLQQESQQKQGEMTGQEMAGQKLSKSVSNTASDSTSVLHKTKKSVKKPVRHVSRRKHRRVASVHHTSKHNKIVHHRHMTRRKHIRYHHKYSPVRKIGVASTSHHVVSAVPLPPLAPEPRGNRNK